VVGAPAVAPAYGTPAAPAAPTTPKANGAETPSKEKKPADEDKKPETAAPALIQVNLPADAKLTIDGALTSSTSASRTFSTPTLDTGKEYFYTLKAEVVRDGKTFSATKRVAVEAGKTAKIAIEIPEATVASK